MRDAKQNKEKATKTLRKHGQSKDKAGKQQLRRMESREAGHYNNKESKESMENRESRGSVQAGKAGKLGKQCKQGKHGSMEGGNAGKQGSGPKGGKGERFSCVPIETDCFLDKISRRKFSPAQSGGKVEFNPFQVSEWSEETSSVLRFLFLSEWLRGWFGERAKRASSVFRFLGLRASEGSEARFSVGHRQPQEAGLSENCSENLCVSTAGGP